MTKRFEKRIPIVNVIIKVQKFQKKINPLDNDRKSCKSFRIFPNNRQFLRPANG